MFIKDFIQFFKTPAELAKTQKELTEAQKQMATLRADVIHTLEAFTAMQQSNLTYRFNVYNSYASSVAEISSKYRGLADWGCALTKSIVELRSTFTIGNGLKLSDPDAKEPEPVKKPEGEKTKPAQPKEKQLSPAMEWIQNFLEVNGLDGENLQELVKEAEIEGQIAIQLFKQADAEGNEQVYLKHLSWSKYDYEVKAGTIRGVWETLTYTDPDTKQKVILKENEFVYKRFSGRLEDDNEAIPQIGFALPYIEAVDKGLYDWRLVDNLFTSPTPYFQTETKEDAANILSSIKAINWRPGKALAGNAIFSFVSPDAAHAQVIKEEIVVNVQMISSIVCLPVHFLGMPDLMSNRSTAESLFELVGAGSSKPRTIWEGAFNEIFKKALIMAGVTGLIKCTIPFFTKEQFQQLVDVWFPIWKENGISLQTFLSKVPDIDPVEELARLEEAETKRAEETIAKMELLTKRAEGQETGEPREPFKKI